MDGWRVRRPVGQRRRDHHRDGPAGAFQAGRLIGSGAEFGAAFALKASSRPSGTRLVVFAHLCYAMVRLAGALATGHRPDGAGMGIAAAASPAQSDQDERARVLRASPPYPECRVASPLGRARRRLARRAARLGPGRRTAQHLHLEGAHLHRRHQRHGPCSRVWRSTGTSTSIRGDEADAHRAAISSGWRA